MALYPPTPFNSELICEVVFLPPPVPQCISPRFYHTFCFTVDLSKCLYSHPPNHQPIAVTFFFFFFVDYCLSPWDSPFLLIVGQISAFYLPIFSSPVHGLVLFF